MNDPLREFDQPLGPATPGGEDPTLERMWPLDLALATLGGLVIYTVVTRLDTADARVLYNPLTYAVLVPLGVVALSLLLRNVASRFVRRSMQLGFLLSITVHLLLLLAAFNVMILAPLWPSATSGVQPTRVPVRKTVPDYLFSRTDVRPDQPDWARPVDAQMTSRDVPDQPRPPEPIDAVEPELELPREAPVAESESQPQPAARRPSSAAMPELVAAAPTPTRRQPTGAAPDLVSPVQVPQLPKPVPSDTSAPARSLPETTPRRATQITRAPLPTPESAPTTLPQFQPELTVPAAQRATTADRAQPQVGEVATSDASTARRIDRRTLAPAGAIPQTPSVNIARSSNDAALQLNDAAAPLESPRGTTGASLQPAPTEVGELTGPATVGSEGPVAPRTLRPGGGQPEVTAGNVGATSPRRRGPLNRDRLPPGALGGPDVSELNIASQGERGDSASESGNREATAPLDRLAGENRSATSSSATTGAELDAGGIAGPPPGLTSTQMAGGGSPTTPLQPTRRPGWEADGSLPQIASSDVGRFPKRRRELGAPMAPAGDTVSGLRPFDRRTQRTLGGAAPTPVGMVGPQTEEAIERGLAYLADRQNANGSWSLQGHGDEVLMQSDTAATGLCLLAFQGAGYTHKQHQYADTVSRGLEFLKRIQRSNGDLYQRENEVSDRNAWLYSHGIAALALCEAYGMTRDPELRRPAQSALNFIVQTQDPVSGGWRYEPRSSSDTSVTGWMMMALKSGELAGLSVPEKAYRGIGRWMDLAQAPSEDASRYRYNPLAPDNERQRHGWEVTPTMTAVGLLARLYLGWQRERPEMQRGADYLAQFPPRIGDVRDNDRDTYYWYYATQVMFHMGGDTWTQWNERLNPILVGSQQRDGDNAGSWDPRRPVPDRWARYAGRIYVTSMNLLSLEVYYRHLPIYDDTGYEITGN